MAGLVIIVKRSCSDTDAGTNLWLVGQAVKTPPSHGGNSGSIPLRATILLVFKWALTSPLSFCIFAGSAVTGL